MKKVAVLFLLLLFLFLPAVANGPPEAASAESAPEEGYTPEEMLSLWYEIGSYLRENGLYPFVQLQKGDLGYEVRALQIRLAELGYYSKALADNFGNGTYAAMRKFESINDLPVNGIASVEDQKRLFSPKALANSGAPVKAPADDPTDKPQGSSEETPAPDDGDDSSGTNLALPRFTIKPKNYDPFSASTPTPTPTPKPTLVLTVGPYHTLKPPLGGF